MNILYFWYHERNPEMGGVERVTSSWVDYFTHHPDQGVTAYSLSWQKPIKKRINEYFLPDQHDLTSAANTEALAQLLKDLDIKIIINQAGEADWIVRFMRQAIGARDIRICSVLHSNPDYPLYQLNCDLEKKFRSNSFSPVRWIRKNLKIKRNTRRLTKRWLQVIQQSDLFILLSESYFDKFDDKHFKELKYKFRAIPNPTPFTSETTEFSTEKQLLFVGRIENDPKMVKDLIDVWEHVSVQNPDWKFSLVGDGKDKEALIEQTKQRKITNIFFYGSQNPVPFYQNASVLCMASKTEGLPMVQIESLQFGLAQIAYGSFESITDTISDDKNGFIIKPFDQAQYIRQLNMLLKDEQLRHRFQKESIKIRSKFEEKEIAQKWINLFKSL